MRPDDPRVLAVAAALVGLVDALRDETASTSAPAPTHYYSDPRRGAAPPGFSSRTFRERARDIGAQKLGGSWVISREAFEAWASGVASSTPPNVVSIAPSKWSPSAAIERAGGRRVGR